MYDLSTVYNDTIDYLVSQCGLGLPCKLVKSEGECITCPNCVYNPITKKSLNKYKAGGPIPFSNGTVCPFCLGKGQSTEKFEEYITMLVCWDKKRDINIFNINELQIPHGGVQSVCKIEYYLKVISADFVYFNVCDGCIDPDRYKMFGKPQPVGVGRPKFIITTWELVS